MRGLDLVEIVLANEDRWDRYVAAQWLNIRWFIDENPEDKIVPELRAELDTEPLRHVRYQRRHVGWGVFALMKRVRNRTGEDGAVTNPGMAGPRRLQAVLSSLVTACEDDERVLAAWLGGSFARDAADDWSDIDLHLLVADPEDFGCGATNWVGRALPLVLADAIPGVPGGFIFVTPEWVHVDLVVHGAPGFEQGPQPAKVFLDRRGLVREIRPEEETILAAPYLPEESVRLFLYFMGNVVTLVERGEWAALAQATSAMRDSMLVSLMLAENGIRKRDGAKRLNRYLSPAQREILRSLPPVGVDRAGLLEAQEAMARDYLVRGRRLAEVVGLAWPDELEEAVRGLWLRQLGIVLG